MTYQCSAHGCRYHDNLVDKEKGISFHRFPHRNANLLWIWVVNMNRGKWTPKARSLLCSRHFTPDCFEEYQNKRRLKHTAIPTIFPKDKLQIACPEPVIDEPTPNKFQSACLTAHNTIREEYGLPKLSWSEEAAASAKEWAKILATKGYLQHSENRVYGENILITEEKENVSGSQVVAAWLEEAGVYQFDSPMWQYNTSHFTQMVWKNSTEFGVAKARLRNKNKYVVVAHYKPIGNGNMPGEYKKNVPGEKTNITLDIRQDPESDPESEPEPEKERSLIRTPSKRKAEEIALRERYAKRAVAGEESNIHEITEDVVQQESKVVKTTPLWDASEYEESMTNEQNDDKETNGEITFNGLNDIQMVEFDEPQSDPVDDGEVVEEEAVNHQVNISKPIDLTFFEDEEVEHAGGVNGNGTEFEGGVILHRGDSEGEDTEV